jgi:hypothetical protein
MFDFLIYKLKNIMSKWSKDNLINIILSSKTQKEVLIKLGLSL